MEFAVLHLQGDRVHRDGCTELVGQRWTEVAAGARLAEQDDGGVRLSTTAAAACVYPSFVYSASAGLSTT